MDAARRALPCDLKVLVVRDERPDRLGPLLVEQPSVIVVDRHALGTPRGLLAYVGYGIRDSHQLNPRVVHDPAKVAPPVRMHQPDDRDAKAPLVRRSPS